MKRIKIVHQLLWYLVYGYGEPVDLPGGTNDAETGLAAAESSAETDVSTLCFYSLNNM